MKFLIDGYTVTEQLKLKRSSNIDKEKIKEIDKFIGHLKRNRRQYRRLILLLALIIPSTTLQVFASESGILAVVLDGYKYLKDIAYGICLIGGAVEAIKSVVSGTIDQLGRVAVKYTAFALMIKFLPTAVDIIFSLGGK